jgi:O-antigen/teichoic acid export membrane protein
MKQQVTGNIFYSLILTIVVQIFLLQNAFAYLDPGTGSYVFQVLVAAFIGGLFTIKIYWRKIKDFIINCFSKKQEK